MMWQRISISCQLQNGAFRDKQTGLGWATLVTAMQVAFCLTRIPACYAGEPPIAAAIRTLPQVQDHPSRKHMKSASRPTHTFFIGQICIAAGMAVVTLAFWLHIMHVSRWIGW